MSVSAGSLVSSGSAASVARVQSARDAEQIANGSERQWRIGVPGQVSWQARATLAGWSPRLQADPFDIEVGKAVATAVVELRRACVGSVLGLLRWRVSHVVEACKPAKVCR